MTFSTILRHVDSGLEHEDWFTLNQRVKADLMVLCEERGLATDGSKEALISRLWEWKVKMKPVPAPASPKLLSITSIYGGSEFVPSELGGRGGSAEGGQGGGVGNGMNDPGSMDVSEVSAHLTSDTEVQLNEIPHDMLTYGKKMGFGGFKDCFTGKYNNEPVAIGVVRLTGFTKEDFKEIKHEIAVLQQLRHDNIIRFYGISTSPTNLCIITELCDHGDLYDYMSKTRKPPFSRQVSYMYDIAFGVAYLHGRRPGIIHRDLKSMNILVSKDNRAKINDFGLARIRPGSKTTMHTQCGTPNWQAPEFWNEKPSYTEKVDVYACGLIFWEILQWGAASYPYHDMTEHQLYVAVRDQGVRPPLDNLRKYSKELIDLIELMWAGDPKVRPSMSYVQDQLNEYLM